ncbi:cytochrome P450 [Streptomyces heilongjiangensis]|uniref:Cytochrome P450 n=2 Tax=Streptomyces TaxID=1883 RepID=A0ABW1BB56_9ACTN|nr:cytochrome P450 [Streptomyces heilongjiangensis]MDC2950555.1 cytochrome P450 [Streptomyces heilongjiangensis]
MTDVQTTPDSPAPTESIPVPGPMRLRDMREVIRNVPRYLTGLRDEHGPVVRVPMGKTDAFLISDFDVVQDVIIASSKRFDKDAQKVGPGPDDWGSSLERVLGKGLVTSVGTYHRRQRRLIQPVFHRRRIAGYGEAFATIADEASAGFQDGTRFNFHEAMYELALGMVTRTLFDVSLESEAADGIRRAFPREGGPLRWELSPFGKILLRLPLPANRQFKRGLKTVDEIVYGMIEERRKGPGDGDDLLSVLLTVTDADTGEHLTDQELRDEAITLLMAGHETSSGSLTWTYYLLGTHPEIREKLHAEIDEVLGDRLPTVEDLPRLKYTDAVYSEALRLFPPAWVLVRRALEDYAANGYHIPRNSVLMVSPYVLHRDRTWWPEPERFAPERFLADAEPDPANPLLGHARAAGRPKLAYLPFGAGPRQCIGNVFAQMEGVMALATLSRHWEFEPVGPAPDRVTSDFTLQPRGGLEVVAHRRR